MPCQDLHSWLAPLTISDEKLIALASQLSTTYSHLAMHSTEQFLATPITKLPTGEEKGEFLAVDLGGTNLRISFVELLGTRTHSDVATLHLNSAQDPLHGANFPSFEHCIRKTYGRSWLIAEQLKAENTEGLFHWLGKCLFEVITDRLDDLRMARKDIPRKLSLGITFSFPMMQSTLAKARLLPMGKGFRVPLDADLANMVLEGFDNHIKSIEIDRKQPPFSLPELQIVAIANDTVATLISSLYISRLVPRRWTVMSLIIGTGTNAAISMEPQVLHASKRPEANDRLDHTHVVLNTEWTLQGAAGPLRDLDIITSWDILLDRSLDKPGFQPFEYMTAGRYIGEIVRLIAVDWFQSKLGFEKSVLPPELLKKDSLNPIFLAQYVAGQSDAELLERIIESKWGPYQGNGKAPMSELAQVVCEVEKVVLRRSAAMIGAAVVGLLSSTGEISLRQSTISPNHSKAYSNPSNQPEGLVVAYSGSLICLYPGYKEQVQAFIDRLSGLYMMHEKKRIRLCEALEGGLIGASVLAATVESSSDMTTV